MCVCVSIDGNPWTWTNFYLKQFWCITSLAKDHQVETSISLLESRLDRRVNYCPCFSLSLAVDGHPSSSWTTGHSSVQGSPLSPASGHSCLRHSNYWFIVNFNNDHALAIWCVSAFVYECTLWPQEHFQLPLDFATRTSPPPLRSQRLILFKWKISTWSWTMINSPSL